MNKNKPASEVPTPHEPQQQTNQNQICMYGI